MKSVNAWGVPKPVLLDIQMPGMDDYIAKPIKRELVFDMIKKWVLEG